MKYKTLSFFLFGFFLLNGTVVAAQTGTTKIVGKVIESSERPIEFATVLVADVETKKPIEGT